MATRYALLFLVLSLAWLWPVPARLTTRIAHDLGDPILNSWILWWYTQAVPFTERWWSPPFFFPMPGALTLSEHLLGIAVFTTPLQLAGLNAIGAYNTAVILSFWLSGVFAFLLARRLTGSTLAGVVAGVAFAFAPYRASQLSHVQVLTSQWMPVALYAMHAYLDDRRPRWLALFAGAWLLQALSNGYFLFYFPVLIGAWLLWFVRWRRDPRPGLMLAGTFALASLLLLPVLLKYRAVHQELGLGRHWHEILHFSADADAFLRMSDLLAFWPYVKAEHGEDQLFPGITMLALAIAAGALGWRRWRGAFARRSTLLFYVLVTLVIWWLALGPAPPDHPWQRFVKPYTWVAWLPGFNGLRAPSRFVMLSALTLSVAGALALTRLLPHHRLARVAMIVLVFAGLTVDGWVDAIPMPPPIPRLDLVNVDDAVVLELPVDSSDVGTAAMYRMMTHRRPLVNGYSGHTPPHLRLISTAIQRGDESSILAFTEGRPLVVVVNNRLDAARWYEEFVASQPGAQTIGVSAAGPVFRLPARPVEATKPMGPQIPVRSVEYGERRHVTLDLGAPQTVRGFSFPVRWRFERLDARIEVEASLDNSNWTRAWFGGTARPAILGALEHPREIPFRVQLGDVQARYLRIHPFQEWNVKELVIFADR